MSKPLDLKLTDEEKFDLMIKTGMELGYTSLDDITAKQFAILGDAIADAAVAKATWGIVEWLWDEDRFPDPDPAMSLQDFLEAQGISRPEGE